MARNNISDFAGKFLKGGIRPSLFEVQGNFPFFGQDASAPFLIKAAQLPASTLGTIEVPYRGRKIKVPGDRTFAEWQITVLADGDFQLRDKFEAWMQSINAHEANTSLEEPAPLQDGTVYQDWQVYQLDRQGNKIKSYNFIGCWPSEVGAIDVNHETTDSLAEFTVTLQYTYWSSNTTDGDGTILGAISGIVAP
tara:strand:- start:261 stop:842 length:582 start_codon:yes stop_codon:yes gene_type:complete